jgi:hypothetical protein
MAVLTPMPRASTPTASTDEPGFRARSLKAQRASRPAATRNSRDKVRTIWQNPGSQPGGQCIIWPMRERRYPPSGNRASGV